MKINQSWKSINQSINQSINHENHENHENQSIMKITKTNELIDIANSFSWTLSQRHTRDY